MQLNTQMESWPVFSTGEVGKLRNPKNDGTLR